MAQSLITRNEEQRVILSNSQLARKIQDNDIGNWNHFRVGIRCNVNVEGYYYNPPPIFIGLCSGEVNKFLSLETDHAIGIITNDSTDNWSEYLSTTVRRIYIPTSEVKIVKKENSVLTKYNNSNNYHTMTIYGVTTSTSEEFSNSGSILVDFIKNNSDIECSFYYNNDRSVSKETFDLIINNPIVPTQYMERKGSATILNVNELANGMLDHVNVGWYSADFDLEINDLAYSIFS